MKSASGFIFVITLFVPTLGNAQLSGGKVVRVGDSPDVTERCIDPYKDKVWLTLRSLTVTKSKGWFTNDKDVMVSINAKVQTDPAPPSPISFPLVTTAKFSDGPAGQVSVPIEYSIVTGLLLKQGGIVYSGLGADITLINLKNRGSLGSALQALDAITSSQKIPIPSSPATQAASYLIGFANSAVQKDIDAQKEDKAVAGALQFNFDPNGECLVGDFERTGTKAIVFADGDTAAGSYVDVGKITNYCFRATLTPTFSLTAALANGADCRTLPAQRFKPVSNNYIGLYLNKQSVNRSLGASPAAERDRRDSLARCNAHGIAARDCIPAAAE